MADDFDFRSVGGVHVVSGTNGVWNFGWQPPTPEDLLNVKAQLQFPTAADTPAAAIPTAELPKAVYLWKAYEQIKGAKCPARNQRQVGSCVSFGTAKAVEHTMCCEIVAGDPEEFRDLAQEVIYGGSRVEVGGGRLRGDGSVGAWAADFVKKWGVVARGKYGSYDLSAYSESTCRRFGDAGVPAELETEAKLHPVSDITQVREWDNAKKLLAAGHGIAICSGQGFSMQRDGNGICKASGSWAHCMALDGYQVADDGKEYGHITNSWGPDAHTGPVGWGEPNTDGFWAASATVARMLGADDSWAFAGVAGWRAAVLPPWLI